MVVSHLPAFISAYQANDIKQFEKILARNKASIMSDPFVREYIQGSPPSRRVVHRLIWLPFRALDQHSNPSVGANAAALYSSSDDLPC
jgi:hypothetical protein